MAASIDHVHISVEDQYASADWWNKLLGFEILKDFESWAAEGPLSISADGGKTKLALFKKSEHHPWQSNKRNETAFHLNCDEFFLFYEKTQEWLVKNTNGGSITKKDIIDHDLAFSIYFLDPDSNRFEVTTYETDKAKARIGAMNE